MTEEFSLEDLASLPEFHHPASSPDGERVAVYYDGTGRNELHVIDVATGEMRWVSDGEVPRNARWPFMWAPDGGRIAYVTNESDDLNNSDVYVADADGSDVQNLEIGIDGSEPRFADWSPDGTRLLVSDDTKDKTRCGIYDLESDSVEWFGSGEYVENPVAFLPDGGGFIALRTRRAAVVPLVYDLGGDATELHLPIGVASFPQYGDAALLGDGRVLVEQTTPTQRPALLVHDVESGATRTLLEPEYGDIDLDSFADAEYVIFESHDGLEINYRGSFGRGREFKNSLIGDWGGAEQDDIAEGVRWLRERERIDEERVIVYGGSYGGYSAYWQMVRYSELYAAGIAWVGVTDLHDIYENTMPHFQTGLMERYLGDPEENHDLYRERSPIEYAENLDKPLLMVHGVNDRRVPVSQARLFRDALDEVGFEEGEDRDYEYEELGEEGHGSTDIDQKIRSFEIVDDFLARRVSAQ
ncbi:S9 family peptidase [Haladaptatus halobius]|uniref:S9 family peptidase n=1 Tax=Haladaptatus halobius TaxID=2884875 RepID=UPI001D0A8B06|nr:prolyl oligopeptidase family serine peptidase [Haladaptatus halobius]